MEYKIIVVGIGPGSPDYIPPIASRAIAQAKVVVGSSRALATLAPENCETKVIDRDITGIMNFIGQHLLSGNVTVLVSGDPGFYSLLAALSLEFPPEVLQVIPGISSVQLAFARLSCPWQDADLISLHGREVDKARLAFRAGAKLAFLTDGKYNPRQIATMLLDLGWPADAKAWLCAELSYPTERIVSGRLATLTEIDGFEHSVMVVMA